MDWKGRRASTNVEDQRGRSVKGMVGGGLGVVSVIIAIVFALLGGDPSQVSNVLPTDTVIDSSYTASAEEEELAQFVSVVLAETEEVWAEQF